MKQKLKRAFDFMVGITYPDLGTAVALVSCGRLGADAGSTFTWIFCTTLGIIVYCTAQRPKK